MTWKRSTKAGAKSSNEYGLPPMPGTRTKADPSPPQSSTSRRTPLTETKVWSGAAVAGVDMPIDRTRTTEANIDLSQLMRRSPPSKVSRDAYADRPRLDVVERRGRE